MFSAVVRKMGIIQPQFVEVEQHQIFREHAHEVKLLKLQDFRILGTAPPVDMRGEVNLLSGPSLSAEQSFPRVSTETDRRLSTYLRRP